MLRVAENTGMPHLITAFASQTHPAAQLQRAGAAGGQKAVLLASPQPLQHTIDQNTREPNQRACRVLARSNRSTHVVSDIKEAAAFRTSLQLSIAEPKPASSAACCCPTSCCPAPRPRVCQSSIASTCAPNTESRSATNRKKRAPFSAASNARLPAGRSPSHCLRRGRQFHAVQGKQFQNTWENILAQNIK